MAVCTRVGWPELLERVLQGEAVDDRGEHAHVVGLGAVHAGAGAGHAPPDVAAADHDGDVDVEVAADLDDLLGELGARRRRRCRSPASPAKASPDSFRSDPATSGAAGDRRRPRPQAPMTTWAKRTSVALAEELR